MSRATRVCVSVLLVLLQSLPLMAATTAREREELVASAEQIGRLHNEMLDAVAEAGLLEKGDMSAMIELMNERLSEKLGGKVDSREIAELADRSRDPEAVSRELDDRQQQLFHVLQQQVATSPNADVMIRRLRSYENTLLRRSDLTTEQKRPLLVAAVVGRYSAEYWNEAATNPKSAWYRFVGPKEGGDGVGELPKWVEADLRAGLLAMQQLAHLLPTRPLAYVVGVVGSAAAASIVAAMEMD